MVSNSLTHTPTGVGGFQGSWALQTIMIVFISVAVYNGLELIILILLTFKRYQGLYFWVMLLSSVLGVLPHSIGYLLEFFNFGPLWLALTISTIGFYIMVPGQSIVLYSRLHLVVQNPKVLTFVLYIIIVDAVILLIPTTVLTFSTAYVGSLPVIEGYNVMERLQLAWFCAQEFLISGIYIHETLKLLRLNPQKDDRRNRIMHELLAINFFIILMDISLLVLEYVGLYPLQTTLKPAVYSLKLKLELGVLGKLVALVQPHREIRFPSEQTYFPTFVDPARITTDFTHAAPPDTGGPHIRRPRSFSSMESFGTDSTHSTLSHRSSRPP